MAAHTMNVDDLLGEIACTMEIDAPTEEVAAPLDEVLLTKPPALRKKPQRRMGIGTGKYYADAAAFNADLTKWHEEHAARKVLVEEYERQQDRLRDRSTRTQRSGAQHRKQAGAAAPEKAASQRWRSRKNYHRRVQEIVDANRFESGQRVRVRIGPHKGKCGWVSERVGSKLSVQLDQLERGALVDAAPHTIEPWPRIGQEINWIRGSPGEIATVVAYAGQAGKVDQENQDHQELWNGAMFPSGTQVGDPYAVYELSRVIYASPKDIIGLAGQEIRVGAQVQASQKDDEPDDYSRPTNQVKSWLQNMGGDHESKFVVKAICTECTECVELVHTFRLQHTAFDLDLLERAAAEGWVPGCPFDHENKCQHMGHSDKCQFHCACCSEMEDLCVCYSCDESD